MNQTHSTGYYDMGEVEDYQVIVDNFPLPVTLISFDANSINDEKVKLTWSANEEPGFDRYEIERSKDGTNWERMNIVPASVAGGLQSYELMDHSPLIGASQYRIKMVDGNTAAKFSQVRTVRISTDGTGISLYPNPAREKINVFFKGNTRGGAANIRVLNSTGATLISETAKLSTGDNIVPINLPGSIAPGVYIVFVQKGGEVFTEKLIVN
jgi:hypothetical protein